MTHIKKAFDPAPEPLQCPTVQASALLKVCLVTFLFRLAP